MGKAGCEATSPFVTYSWEADRTLGGRQAEGTTCATSPFGALRERGGVQDGAARVPSRRLARAARLAHGPRRNRFSTVRLHEALISVCGNDGHGLDHYSLTARLRSLPCSLL
jgi:hypothetical protein